MRILSALALVTLLCVSVGCPDSTPAPSTPSAPAPTENPGSTEQEVEKTDE